ncbi:VIR protein [Plasmodium vivax]|uniref:VIR protein n=1 Tax=Plasmodium vivax TaxID=5855 RepID=A0A1G4E6T3_PLAVI|nr:VIR protein [Plasmodium vivax]
MGCTTEINYDTYNFFDNIINYIESSDKLESNTVQLDSEDDCTSFSHTNTRGNLELGKKVCELFVKLYKSLPSVQKKDHSDYKKEWHFLNYWLNFNISKYKLNAITCATNFSDGLGHHCMHTLGFEFPPASSIYNIREDELIKMNLLYGLYENYKKLDNILNPSQQDNPDLLLELSTKCCSDYIKANYFCKGEKNKFCIQLDNFKKKYEELDSKLVGKSVEYSSNFIKLSECKNTNVMSTALIGTTVGLVPLLVGIYKFTPLGLLFNPNKRKFTQEYKSNGEEMRNIMLMDQGSEHISSQQGTYNIKYHSV